MSWETWIELGKLILAGFIGGYATFWFEKRKQSFARNLDEKRAIYSEFISIIIDLFAKSKKTNANVADEEFIQKYYEFYKKFMLYASDKSIDAFGDWMAYLRQEELDERVWVSKLSILLGYMRKDLGLSNLRLGVDNTKIMRAILTDYDSIFQPKK